MEKFKLLHGDNLIEFTTITQAEQYKIDNQLNVEIQTFNEVEEDNTLYTVISGKILHYEQLAPYLIRDLKIMNTINGITAEQSDQMFDDFNDVLIRLKEGAWPTAIYRLNQKVPSGFVTQELIDQWITKITSFMNS